MELVLVVVDYYGGWNSFRGGSSNGKSYNNGNSINNDSSSSSKSGITNSSSESLLDILVQKVEALLVKIIIVI